jgi:hypothetical protein
VLTVTSTEDPKVSTQVLVPMRYDCSVVVDRSGRKGDAGTKGQDGADNPGGNAGPGESGSVGDAGKDGSEVHVRAVMGEEPRSGKPILLAEIQVLGEDEKAYAAIFPGEGELVVKVNGGKGGQGGQGGDGGNAMPSQPDASGGGQRGAGGDGGNGGPGGAGGVVTVFADASVNGQLRSIVVENAGGEGGAPGPAGIRGEGGSSSSTYNGQPGQEGRRGEAGPPPEVVAATVAPLW